MSTAPVRDFGAVWSRFVRVEEPAIEVIDRAAELRALAGGLDTAAAADPSVAPCFFHANRGLSSAAERTRLPPPPGAGRDLTGACARILAADTSMPASSREQVAKEAKMRRVLEALAGVVDLVETRAQRERKE